MGIPSAQFRTDFLDEKPGTASGNDDFESLILQGTQGFPIFVHVLYFVEKEEFRLFAVELVVGIDDIGKIQRGKSEKSEILEIHEGEIGSLVFFHWMVRYT